MMPLFRQGRIDLKPELMQFKNGVSQITFDGGPETWVTRMKFLDVSTDVKWENSIFPEKIIHCLNGLFHLD